MTIFAKLKRNKFEKGLCNLVEKISKDSNFRIDSSNRPFRQESFRGIAKTTGTRSYSIKSNDEKNLIEIIHHYSRATGLGTRGLYELNINGKRQKLDQKKLEKLFQFIKEQKSNSESKESTQNHEELIALLQKYVRE